MFEEFDFRTNRQGMFYAYEEASANVLMFDASVTLRQSRDANIGWNPQEPDRIGFPSNYIPLTDKHPDPIFADRGDNNVFGRYRWTRMGLKGIDFGGKEVGLPDNGG